MPIGHFVESIDPLLRELELIRWLLVAVAIGIAAIFALLFSLASSLGKVAREVGKSFYSQHKEAELVELLASGQNDAAKTAAKEWLKLQPRRPEAHWALAKSHYQLGELSEAKQVLNDLLKIAPDENFRVEAWIQHLENEFAQKRPKPI